MRLAFYLLGHPDTQDFGRKFKIAFSGCKDEACALVSMHDLGGIAATRTVDGKIQRGFELFVGGGLGAVPHQAKLFDAFCPEEDLLPTARAIGRVFARLGEKKNRQKARLKFVVQKLGIDEFRRLVLQERETMPPDPTWRKFFDEIPRYEEKPAFASVPLNGSRRPQGYEGWAETNVYRQRQPGYATVTVTLPLGDATSQQFRVLADLTQRYASDCARLTVEQNLVLRWVSESKLPALYDELKKASFGANGAGTIVDVVACPGTDTCKLGIASSRGLAGELRTRLAERSAHLDEAIKGLRIKVSGCFNSCGQHHVADLGFYGNSRHVGNYTVPHFQVMIGGKWLANGGSYGLAIGSIPSKAIPQVVTRVTDRFTKERQPGETFQTFCSRAGQERTQGDDRRPRQSPASLGRPGLLQRLGRPAGIHHRRHGGRRMRRRSRLPGRLRLFRSRGQGIRSPASARCRRAATCRGTRLWCDAQGGANPRSAAVTRRPDRSRYDHRGIPQSTR